jgi:hypothetical protein
MREVANLGEISSGYLCYKAVTDTREIRSNSDKTLWKLKCMVDCLFIPVIEGEYCDVQFAAIQPVIRKLPVLLSLNSSHKGYYPQIEFSQKNKFRRTYLSNFLRYPMHQNNKIFKVNQKSNSKLRHIMLYN